HDGLVPVVAQRKCGVYAAVIELDALADTVRAAAEYHHFLSVGRLRLALFFVSRVHVSRRGRELGRAGIDTLIDRPDTELMATRANHRLVDANQRRQAGIGEALAL